MEHIPSWSGSALQVDNASAANLKYNPVEADGSANINCKIGSVVFWFRPNWSTSAGGPGGIVRLIEMGNTQTPSDGWWALSVSADGTQLKFESEINGTAKGYCEAAINWSASEWHQISITYNTSESKLYIDKALIDTGDGIESYPTLEVRARDGLNIGSARDGTMQAKGLFEELRTYNYVLQSTDIESLYDARTTLTAAQTTVQIPRYVNTSSLLIQVDGAPGSQIAVSSFTFSDLVEGENLVRVGIKDSTGDIAWRTEKIILDTVPPDPIITWPEITDPDGTIVSQPLIQLKGYAAEALSSISYCLTNGVVTNTATPGFITKQEWDSVSLERTTSWFQCFDIDLSPGMNNICLRVVDLAGNETKRPLKYVLDYSGVTAGPNILGQWPQNGAIVSGSSFTLRGQLDDPTARVELSKVIDGETVTFQGLVERDGLFWVENLPLLDGQNTFTVTLVNAANFSTVQPFTVTKGAVNLSIDTASLLIEGKLNNSYANAQKIPVVRGVIDSTEYDVWVNGCRAAPVDGQWPPGGGQWEALDVPLNPGGTASLIVSAIPSAENNTTLNGTTLNNYQSPNPVSVNSVNLNGGMEETDALYESYHWSRYEWQNVNSPSFSDEVNEWSEGSGGSHSRIELEFVMEEEMNPDHVNQVETEDLCLWDYKGVGLGTRTITTTCLADENCPANGQEFQLLDPEDEDEDIPKPWILQWEKSKIDMRFDSLGQGTSIWKHKRSAVTQLRLRTGGKSPSKSQNLFVLHPPAQSATFAREIRPTPEGIYPCEDGDVIPNSLVTFPSLVPNGFQTPDGNLYVLLPDGMVADATPEIAAHDSYTFSVEETKHQIILRANSMPLDPSYNIATAPCVGERVIYNVDIQPPIAGCRLKNHMWNFAPGNSFYNAKACVEPSRQVGPPFTKWYVYPCYPTLASGTELHQPPPVKLESPLFIVWAPSGWLNPFQQPETGVWWYKPGQTKAGCAFDLIFDDGQKLSTIKTGKLYVMTPNSALVLGAPAPQICCWADPSGYNLRLGDANNVGVMDFSASVASPFSGNIMLTQLVNCYRHEYYPHWWDHVTTSNGRYLLDTEECANFPPPAPGQPRVPTPIGEGQEVAARLYDAPGMNAGVGSVYSDSRLYIHDTFKTYVRFKPNTEDSIYATIGVIDWSWRAAATDPGVFLFGAPHYILGPTLDTNCKEIPVWEDNIINQ